MEPPSGTQPNASDSNHHQQQPTSTSMAAPPTIKTLTMFTHSVPSSQTEKKKMLGWSRKHFSLELTRKAAKKSAAKKAQMAAFGNAGKWFDHHVITVNQGEDVVQKIMKFVQQSKRDICVLSATGAISDAFLHHPISPGGNIVCEGQYDIISLSGSYVCCGTGTRSGGLSICLSSAGQLIGGSVGGPLKAAGSVQVLLITFVNDNKRDVDTGSKGDASGSTSVGGVPISGMGLRSPVESSGLDPVKGNDNNQIVGGSLKNIHVAPSRPTSRTVHDGRSNSSSDMTGTGHHGAQQSSKNDDHSRSAN